MREDELSLAALGRDFLERHFPGALSFFNAGLESAGDLVHFGLVILDRTLQFVNKAFEAVQALNFQRAAVFGLGLCFLLSAALHVLLDLVLVLHQLAYQGNQVVQLRVEHGLLCLRLVVLLKQLRKQLVGELHGLLGVRRRKLLCVHLRLF